MKAEYTFKINSVDCEPIYGDNLSLVLEKQQRELFYRRKLSGELAFVGDDYDFIKNAPFTTTFTLEIFRDTVLYYAGFFTRLDCEENLDDRIIKVNITNNDSYTEFLQKYDKKYDLIKLKPELEPVYLDKRPIIQVYIFNSESVSCFLAGSKWDEPVYDRDLSFEALTNKHLFAHVEVLVDIKIDDPNAPIDIRGHYVGTKDNARRVGGGPYKIVIADSDVGWLPDMRKVEVRRVSDNAKTHIGYTFKDSGFKADIVIADDPGPNTFNAKCVLHDVFVRYVVDKAAQGGLSAYRLPLDDLIPLNHNYKFAIPYVLDVVSITANESGAPTKYGLNNSGNYFAPPTNMFGDIFYPVAQDSWIRASIWFTFSTFDSIIEEQWRKNYRMADAYTLVSVIDLLLKQINPNYSFAKANSQFLYGSSTGVKTFDHEIFLTQKTNILKGQYDQAAQRAETSLKDVLEMLRAVYNCYWRLVGNTLIIEHVSFFMRGGSYIANNVIGLDLTQDFHPKHTLPYSFGANIVRYKVEEVASAYEYAWSEKVTTGFTLPVVETNFTQLNTQKVEKITISGFNPDVDLMLASPSSVSNEGLAILEAKKISNNNIAQGVSTINNTILKTGEAGTQAQSGIRTTDYIAIQSSSNYSIGLLAIGSWFDANKNFISNIFASGGLSVEAESPINAAFLRVSYSSVLSGFYVQLGGSSNIFKVPYLTVHLDGIDYVLQNGTLALKYLVAQYHAYELASPSIMVGNDNVAAKSSLKYKQQNIWYSDEIDPLIERLVKTEIGDGFIESASINLTSRRIDLDLRYDTD